MQTQTTLPSQAIIHLNVMNGENKIFQDKNKFKQYVATNPALQKVLEGKSQAKESNISNTTYNNSDI